MAVTLDATAGGASSNSYVSYEDAVLYFAARLNPVGWGAAGSEDRKRALVTVTARLEALAYKGTRASATQRLAWPRADVPDPDPAAAAAEPTLDSAAVPRRLKDAACEFAELALQAVKADATADPFAPAVLPSVKEIADGETTLVFRDEPPVSALGRERIPAEVLRLLAPLLATAPGGTAVVRSA